MRAEQNTVGMQRAERKEQEELTGKKKIAATLSPDEKLMKLRAKEADINAHPARLPRVGKPLKR